MDRTNIIKRLKLLKFFTKDKNPINFIVECDELFIHGISEVCFNLVSPNRNISLNKQTLKKLYKIRYELNELANPKKSIKNKRKILLQLPEFFFPLLKKTIIPAIKKLIK